MTQERRELKLADIVENEPVVGIKYDEGKNLLLGQRRQVTFDEVLEAITQGDMLDDLEHQNSFRYPDQRILVVQIRSYAYAVPYAIKDGIVFLKTIYPSR